MTRNAIKALKDGKCDIATFWIRNMAHYMSDICLWFHVRSITSSDRASKFESYMSERMRNENAYFFLINRANSLFVVPTKLPSQYVQEVAYIGKYLRVSSSEYGRLFI